MGREAEVVAELLPAFRARHPGIHVRVQQLPWTAAHEKLLTAFAGDALPDLCQLGNTWLPEFAALGALEPLDARVGGARHRRATTTSPASWTPTHADAERRRACSACRGTSTRGCSSIAATCCARPATRSRRDWDEWRDAMRARQASAAAASGYGVLLPLNEPEPLLALRAAARRRCSPTTARRGDFSQRAVPPRARLLRRRLPRGPCAGDEQQRRSRTSGTSSARGLFAFYVTGPWNIGEFRRRLPRERQGDWATAPLPGPDGPGVSIAGGSSLVIFKRSPHKDAAWRLIEYLSEPATMQRFHALTGDLPPRRSAWRDAGARRPMRRRRRSRSSSSACAPAPQIPEWERIFQEMQLAAERVVQRAPELAEARAAQLDAWVDALLEKRRWMLARAAGAATAGDEREPASSAGRSPRRRSRSSPSSSSLPVVAGLALSLTDFDLYALADLSTLRFVGLDNYLRLLQTPLFWQALGNTLYFVVVGVPLSIGLSLGAALLLELAASRKWQALLPHRAVRAGGHHASSPSR